MATVIPLPPSGWPEGRRAAAVPGADAPSAGGPPAPGTPAPLSSARRPGGYLGGRECDARELERVLSHVAAARARAEQARRVLLRTGADPQLIEALADGEKHLRDAQRRLILGLDAGALGPLATA
jgi:hypothetical protein